MIVMSVYQNSATHTENSISPHQNFIQNTRLTCLLTISEVCSDAKMICLADNRRDALKLMSTSDELQVANSNLKLHKKRLYKQKIDISDGFLVYAALTFEHATCYPY